MRLQEFGTFSAPPSAVSADTIQYADSFAMVEGVLSGDGTTPTESLGITEG